MNGTGTADNIAQPETKWYELREAMNLRLDENRIIGQRVEHARRNLEALSKASYNMEDVDVKKKMIEAMSASIDVMNQVDQMK